MRSTTKKSLSFPRIGRDAGLKRIAGVSVLFASMVFCAAAHAEVLVSRYQVNMGGVRMGEAIVHATIDAKRYKVEISADVGTLLNNTKFQGEASGLRSGLKLTPERYKLVMSDGQESAINFTTPSSANPKAANTLKGVLDPLSALLAASMRASSPEATPCDKVLTVIMSRAKIDASLSPSDAAVDPRVVACRVNFAPKEGNTAANAAQLQTVRWQVAFQKLNQPQMWLVEQVSLPTDLGDVTINRVETSISGS